MNDNPSDYISCMLMTRREDIGGPIEAVERLLNTTGCGHVQIAYDEWNLRGWHHPGVMTGFGPAEIQARDRSRAEYKSPGEECRISQTVPKSQ